MTPVRPRTGGPAVPGYRSNAGTKESVRSTASAGGSKSTVASPWSKMSIA